MARPLRISLVQQRADAKPDNNLAAAIDAIRRAAEAGARIVCLQELFRTPYFCQVEDAARFDLAEPIPGDTTEALAKAASDHDVVVIGPVFERRSAGVYHNSAVIFDTDGRQVGHYRKMHVPDDPLFQEKFYFSPGDLGWHAIHTSVCRIGIGLCWDQWFPETARLLALDGAEILFYPTALGWLDGESEAENDTMRDGWITVQRGQAIANGVFWAAPNRVGREGALTFFGSSFVAAPDGRLLAQSPTDAEHVLCVDCDLDEIERQRRSWPFLRDRRIDAYGDLLKRFRR